MRCPGPLLPAHWLGVALAATVAALYMYWEDLGLEFLKTTLLMRIHADSTGAQTAYCYSIISMTRGKGAEVQKLAVFHGTMHAAIRAMQTNPEDFRTQVSCAWALEGLIDQNRPFALKAVGDGALDAVVKALQDWLEKREIQMIVSLLAEFGATAPEIWPLVAKAGGINLIFKVMSRRFEDAVAIGGTIGVALLRMSEDEAMAKELVTHPRISFLAKLVRTNINSSDAVQTIMLATKNMLEYDRERHRDVFLAQSMPEFLVAVLRAHRNHTLIAFAVNSQLAMLAHKNKKAQDTLLEQGAVELLFETAAQHGTPEANMLSPVVPTAFQAFWCLARGNAAVQARLLKAGAVKQFIHFLNVFSEDLRLMGTACAALATLTEGNETNLAAAAAAPEWCQPLLRGQSSVVNVSHLEELLGVW